MPRSRSNSILSSTCSRISRASSPPQAWISRSARVDLPWSICAMIAKLRIWPSDVMRTEHKEGLDPDQREKVPSQDRKRDALSLSGGDQAVVVARAMHGF